MNTYFNQTMPTGMATPFNMGTPTPMGFPQNNGLSWGNIAPAKTTSSTPEELSIIKSQAGNKFDFTDKDAAVAGWDFREGNNLCIEIIDPKTERVRVKYTNEEFNIVLKDKQVLIEILGMVKNFVNTTKLLNIGLDQEVSKQLNIAAGMLEKLLPEAYEAGKKNYGTICQQMQNMLTAQGYQGTWGNGMYNGVIGSAPNYYVNEMSTPMMQNNMMYNPQMQAQQAYMAGQQAAMAQQNMMQNNMMGMPSPMPVGGTMMNGNPFVQGGQPQNVPTQQVTPQIQNIPMPGQPIQGTQGYQPTPQVATVPNPANPSIGGNATTTATARV